jgi:glutaredoxin 3
MTFLHRLVSRYITMHSSSSIDEDKSTQLEPLKGLVLYKTDACPYCIRVLRVINQLQVEILIRDTRRNRKWRDDLQRRTNRTQVPCLFIDGEPMFESNDIIAWIKNEYQ